MTKNSNAAVFCTSADTASATEALRHFDGFDRAYILTLDETLMPEIQDGRRLAPLKSLPTSPEVPLDSVKQALDALCTSLDDPRVMIVDMFWVLRTTWAANMIERWGAVVQDFVTQRNLSVISLYNREHIVEDQLGAALRVHQQIAAPSGLYTNPHWLPSELVARGTLQEQLEFLLGRVVPEFSDNKFYSAPLPNMARGATPSWARRSRNVLSSNASEEKWHIHCLGQLQVFVEGSNKVDWTIPGSAPKKSRALFAYLLNRGEAGAHSDQLGEFLWPDDATEDLKRSRLRHTIAMLRKTLGSKNSVIRNGDHYRLNVPQGSWIDIRAFEQLCRRGLSLLRQSDHAAAVHVYEAAERLYKGDLFEDIQLEYVENEFDDWCVPKRIWLRDMAVKLQYDMSKALRQSGRQREALEHSMKALQMDPLNNDANIEVMRALAAQNRIEAITRQYQQYLKSIVIGGDAEPSDEVLAVYRELVPQSARRSAGTAAR